MVARSWEPGREKGSDRLWVPGWTRWGGGRGMECFAVKEGQWLSNSDHTKCC